MRINNHTIKLVDNWQPPYGPIFSLDLKELEIFKTYIKNNLAHDFIKLSTSLARAAIFFNKKLNKNLKLCGNYGNFYNLVIKNWYLSFWSENY